MKYLYNVNDNIISVKVVNMVTTFEYKNRTVSLIPSGNPEDRLVIFAGGSDPKEDVSSMEEIKKLLKPYIKKGIIEDFNLLSVSSPDWDLDYSPWEAEVSGTAFGGGADQYFCDLKAILQMDQINESIEYEKERTYFTGYSLAGLASIYGITLPDIPYAHCACVSGSLWFPGWTEYISEHVNDICKDSVIYISLGSKEIKTRNPYMKENGTFCQQTDDLLKDNGVNSVFKWNNGNHFYEVDRRMARSIYSLLSSNKLEPEF